MSNDQVHTKDDGTPCGLCQKRDGFCHHHDGSGRSGGGSDERVFTQQECKFVEVGAATGMRNEDIAEVLDCSTDTLRKHFADVLEKAKAKADAKVKATLYQMATNGKNLGATIFWLKTRCGWTPKESVDVNHGQQDDGGPRVQVVMPDSGLLKETGSDE
jgi:hypothetical protein